MAQAKGILPRRDDREVLYKNPQTCGYFVAVKLDPAIDRARVEAWLGAVSGLSDELVERLPPERGAEKGRKVATVAVGLAPGFFTTGGAPVSTRRSSRRRRSHRASRFRTRRRRSPIWLCSTRTSSSTSPASSNAFISKLAQLRPDVQSIWLGAATSAWGAKNSVHILHQADLRAEPVFDTPQPSARPDLRRDRARDATRPPRQPRRAAAERDLREPRRSSARHHIGLTLKGAKTLIRDS
jgi:hypothetical protein